MCQAPILKLLPLATQYTQYPMANYNCLEPHCLEGSHQLLRPRQGPYPLVLCLLRICEGRSLPRCLTGRLAGAVCMVYWAVGARGRFLNCTSAAIAAARRREVRMLSVAMLTVRIAVRHHYLYN
jgi:hypothetical protein